MKLQPSLLRRLAVCACFGFLFTSCDKAKDLININIPMETIDVAFEIPVTKVGSVTLAEFNVSLNTDSIIKANASSFGIANIRSVKIKSCEIKLSNASAEDQFGVLSDCAAQIKSGTNDTWATFAQVSGNPDTFAETINLNVNADLDLKSYFSAASISYKITGTTRRATSTVLQAKAYIKYDMVVGP